MIVGDAQAARTSAAAETLRIRNDMLDLDSVVCRVDDSTLKIIGNFMIARQSLHLIERPFVVVK